MEKGFLGKLKFADMKTRCGKILNKSPPPAPKINDPLSFPALSKSASLKSPSRLPLEMTAPAMVQTPDELILPTVADAAGSARNLCDGPRCALGSAVCSDSVGSASNGTAVSALGSLLANMDITFQEKTRNAGMFVSKNFPVGSVDGVQVPPKEVVDAGSVSPL